MKKIEITIIAAVASFILFSLVLSSQSASAQVISAGTNNTNLNLFDQVNTTILINNTAQYDLFAYAECNYIDPDSNQLAVRSQCNIILKNSKKEFQAALMLNKPGEWKIHSCIAYGSLQNNCENAVPQHVYKFDPLLSINSIPQPNSIDIISPVEGSTVAGDVEISSVTAGNYEKLEFGYTHGRCENVQRQMVNFSNIPIIFNWNAKNVEDGSWNICLFLSGYGYSSSASRSIVLENYNFTLNPISTFNQNVISGIVANQSFILKNSGGVSDVLDISAVIPWNSKIFIYGEQKNRITLAANEEIEIVVAVNIPFVSIGTDALLKLSVTNSKNENIVVEQLLAVSDRLKRSPVVSEIRYSPDPLDQGFDADFSAKIIDLDGDPITDASLCFDESCSNVICQMNYDPAKDMYVCTSKGLYALPIGSHDVFLAAADNTLSTSTSRILVKIARPEVVNILSPYFEEHVTGNVTVKADVYMRSNPIAMFGIGTDASCSGVTYRTMNKDPSTNGTFVYSWNTELIDDGKYFVCVKAAVNQDERLGSRLVYVDNYRFEINPIYRTLDISAGSTADLNYVLMNNGKKSIFNINADLDSSEFQIVGFIVGGRLVDKQTSLELNRGDIVNISVKIAAKSSARTSSNFNLQVSSSSEIIKSTAVIKPTSTNMPPSASIMSTPEPVNYGSDIQFIASNIVDKENDLIVKRDVCADQSCSSVLCSLEYADSRYVCSKNIKTESGLYKYFVVLRDEKMHETIYMKYYSVRKKVEEPVCGGTFDGGFFECRAYSDCSDKEFPPPCFKATALGTDGCLRGKVCCKLEQKGCTSTEGCSVKAVSKSCIYDSGTDRFNVYTGIDWYGGSFSDVLVGTKRSKTYDSYSYIDEENLNQDGVLRIISNVYASDGSVYCSNETYAYCYRSTEPVPLTAVSFVYPVDRTTVNGIMGVEVGLKGLGAVSFAYSAKDSACTDERFESMFCIGNICKLNFDTTKLSDGKYYLCAKAENDKILSTSVSIDVKNYDFSVNPIASTNYLRSADIFEYPIVIRNTGGVIDTITLVPSIDKWDISLSKSGISILPGQSEEIKLIINVPSALEGQKAVASLKVNGNKNTIVSNNEFIIKNSENYAPNIKVVDVTSPVEIGSDVAFTALISDPDNVNAKVCKDQNCTSVYCSMSTSDNEKYVCSFDTSETNAGSHLFYIQAADADKKAVTSSYRFNIKENAPLLIPVDISINYPSPNSIVKGIITAEANVNGTDKIELSYSRTSRKCVDGSWTAMSCSAGACTARLDTTKMDDNEYYLCVRHKHIFSSSYPVFVKNYNFRIEPVFSSNLLKSGSRNQLAFSIKNTGSMVDSYSIEASTDTNWDASVSPAEITLAEDRSANALILLEVPAGILNKTTKLAVNARSKKTGKMIGSSSTLLVAERSNTAPSASNLSALPNVVEQGSSIKFSAIVVDAENDNIVESKICLDEFCRRILCAEDAMKKDSQQYSCNYNISELNSTTYEYFLVLKDSTSQTSRTAGTFTVKDRKANILQSYAGNQSLAQSPRTLEKIVIKNIFVSSSEDSKNNLIDGSLRTYWSTSSILPQSIKADLGEPMSIDGIGIFSVYGKPSAIKILLSQDCINYYPISSASDMNYTNDWYLESFMKTNTRCVNISIEGANMNIITSGEFEIYASRAIIEDDQQPYASSDLMIYLYIGIAAVACILVYIFRENIIDALRRLIFWMKYR